MDQRNTPGRSTGLEKLLQDKDGFMNAILQSLQDGISVLDKDLNIIKVSAWMEKRHATRMPLVGKKCYKAYHDREAPCPWCPSLKVIERGTTQTEIISSTIYDGTVSWVELTCSPLKDPSGQVVGVIEHVKDITSQKLAEDRLRESEERYRILTQSSVTGIYIHQDGKFVYVNDRLVELSGYKREKIIGKIFGNLFTQKKGNWWKGNGLPG